MNRDCKANQFTSIGAHFEVLFTLQDEADGSNEYNNFQRGSLNTTKQLIQDLKNIDIVFHIGDICYANGYLSQWDQFTAQVEPIASTVPYMIARFVTSYLYCLFVLVLFIHFILFGHWRCIISVVTMNVTGLEQDPSMGTQILEENVVYWLRQCSMSLLRTGLNSGMGNFLEIFLR
jgi:hypothetical protein